MTYSSRFFLYAPFGLFLAIALGVGVHWWLAASALSARLQAINGRQLVPGVTMRFASRRIAGFPFSLDTVFRGVSFRVDTPHGPTQWRPEEFAMHSLTYGRDETIFEAAGKQSLDWTKADGGKRHLDFAVGSLHASAISDGGGLARFDLDIVGFGSHDFTAQRLQFHIRRNKGDTLDLAVIADGVQSHGRTAKSEVLEGTMDAAHALDALRAGNERWYEGLEHWRLANGKLHVANANFDVCGAPMKGHGDLTLDSAHRVAGSLVSQSSGLPRGGSGRFQPPSGCPASDQLLGMVTEGLFVGFGDRGPLY